MKKHLTGIEQMKTGMLAFLLCIFFMPARADLRIGVLNFDPPYVYSSNEGFDIDLSRDICSALESKCKLIPMDYHAFFTALDAGEIDIAIGGIFIRPDPKYIFSLPYVLGLSQFITLRASPYLRVADLKGSTIGVIKGNPAESYFLDSLFTGYANQFHIKSYDNVNDIITALNNKTISAAYMHRSSVRYWTQNCSLFKALGPVKPVGTGIGVMSTLKNANLIEQINQILMRMESNNSYINLYRTYFYN